LAAPPGAQTELVARDSVRFYAPPYVGTRGWVGVRLDVAGFDPAELDELVLDAYLAVAPLTLRRRLLES
jgi:hypothetical protein